MVQYDKMILNKLLDIYESSSLSIGENVRTVHIDVRFVKTFIPSYFDESSEEYEKIHILMQQLEDKNLIQIIWKDNKKGHIISKVRLKVEHLNLAYAYVKRKSKAELVSDNIEKLEEVLSQTYATVCKNFVTYLLSRLKHNKPVKEFIKLDDWKGTLDLLKAIRSVEENTKQMYLREFSISIFQDSKMFESMMRKVYNIFEHFGDKNISEDLAEWLAEYNIYQTPNFVYLKGDATIHIGNTIIELVAFNQGIGISGDDINKIQIDETAKIEKILTIENLTTYFRWKEANSLIVYLGGYHNLVRRNLLRKIYDAFPNAKYAHFGDIDAGGFEIYRDLCEKTKIPFNMYNMDLNVLKKYEKYGKSLTQSDRKRLEHIQNEMNLSELIAYMLEHNIKLEQECMGLEK